MLAACLNENPICQCLGPPPSSSQRPAKMWGVSQKNLQNFRFFNKDEKSIVILLLRRKLPPKEPS